MTKIYVHKQWFGNDEASTCWAIYPTHNHSYERIRGIDIPLTLYGGYYNGATDRYKLHEVMRLFLGREAKAVAHSWNPAKSGGEVNLPEPVRFGTPSSATVVMESNIQDPPVGPFYSSCEQTLSVSAIDQR